MRFAVWAPNAENVSVVGDFNGWERGKHALSPLEDSGVWHGFVKGVGVGNLYKYFIRGRSGFEGEKADPFGFAQELPPQTASAVTELSYTWDDAAWMKSRGERNALSSPMSIYEVHLGSWMRVSDEGYRSLSYRELGERLSAYVREQGFTHVEFLPVMEHPFYGSWGYQVTGHFAPTARYGSPHEFMELVDVLHQAEIGVILDWVPAHFPKDAHGLGYFDGTHLFEHADPRQGLHPDWDSLIYNYDRHEVRSFLLSSATFWLDRYHIDGLRVDGVASMLYLDYSRREGEWIPNQHGGRENLGAIQLLRSLNESVYRDYPDVQTIAEESTAWPMVSRPTYLGGLGFGLKWDMGWMHDTLQYFSKEPVFRRYHQGDLTFRALYAFNENFTLPLSHDEVVHGKGSLLQKMPGDLWQKFANLRLLYAYMFASPGKKLLFMGAEFAQWSEWNHDGTLEWHLLEQQSHAGMQRLVQELNRIYRGTSALHQLDCDGAGFQWVDTSDSDSSVLSFLRLGQNDEARVLIVCNFTPLPRHNYRVGVDSDGFWHEILNSDADEFGGRGHGNLGGVEAAPVPWHGRRCSLNLTLPPLSAIYLSRED